MQPNMVQHQIDLEALYNKNQTLSRIKHEFYIAEGVVEYLEACKIPVQFGIELLAQMALHKRSTLPTMVGILKHHYDDCQYTADMILKCVEDDIVDWNPTLKMLILKYEITRDVQDELDRYQYPLPMVVEPREVEKNTDNGYLLSTSSIILKDNFHNSDVCLDHINRVNKIRLTINHTVAHMVKNQWRNLDKPKEGESKDDFEKRKRAFDKYDRTAKDVMAKVTEHSDTFYLTHRYDKRGRVYCQGYHVNYQGTPWNKAVVEFADKELVI